MGPDSMRRIGIVGMGHIGRTLAKGLKNSGYDMGLVVGSVRTEKKRDEFLKEGINCVLSNCEVIEFNKGVEILFMCCPSIVFEGIIKELALLLYKYKPIIVSFCAAVLSSHITSWIQEEVKSWVPEVMLCMPNIAMEQCAGTSVKYSKNLSKKGREIADSILDLVMFSHEADSLQGFEQSYLFAGSLPGILAFLLETLGSNKLCSREAFEKLIPVICKSFGDILAKNFEFDTPLENDTIWDTKISSALNASIKRQKEIQSSIQS